jgi:hypothetical protein
LCVCVCVFACACVCRPAHPNFRVAMAGQYPPALKSLMSHKRNFKQLEDFNVEHDEEAKKYNEEYMRKMAGGH